MASTISAPRFWLVFSVPPSHLTTCKRAVFEAGVGRFAGYSNVCYETMGTSEFMPGTVSAADGEPVEPPFRKEEVRVQVFCIGKEATIMAVEAMKK
jgi:hypothetical protein